MEIRELFDGEMHEIVPAEWKPVEFKVVDWVEVTQAYEPAELETPNLNWVTEDLTQSERLTYGVEGGWSTIACMLQAVSKALGGNPLCYQKGKRYFFQHRPVEEDG